MKHNTSKIFASILSLVVVGGLRADLLTPSPNPGDVGDADSFGHNAMYMGAASGFVILSPNCSAEPPPQPDTQCFDLVPAPGLTTFDAEDICRIKLPKKSTRTIIYPVLTFFQNYQLQNSTGAPQSQALFEYQVFLSIESAALNVPGLIDPATGLPANGQLQFLFGPNRVRDDRSLAVDERIRERQTFTRAGNLGITKSFLVEYGIPQHVVDNLFKGAMTIHMNVIGSARLVTDASITGNMRLFGD